MLLTKMEGRHVGGFLQRLRQKEGNEDITRDGILDEDNLEEVNLVSWNVSDRLV